MTMNSARVVGRLVLLVALACLMPAAFAGKGGNKGGGKGDPGSALPPIEVVFLGRAEGSTCINCGYDIYVATANQTAMRRVTDDLSLGTNFILDATGTYAFTDGFGTPRTTNLDTDLTEVSSVVAVGSSQLPLLTQLRNQSGLLPLAQQYVFRNDKFDTDVLRVDTGETVPTQNLVLRPLDGGADWMLSDNDHSWDPDTEIFVRRDSHAQTLFMTQSVAWIAWAIHGPARAGLRVRGDRPDLDPALFRRGSPHQDAG